MALRSVLTRSSLVAIVALLAFAGTLLPARADVKMSFTFGVGAMPPPPPAEAADAEPSSTAISDFDYPKPCGAKKLQYFTYAAQIFNSIVVSNAVHHGSRGVTIFGTSRTVWPYLGELAVEDYVFRHFTERMSCKVRTWVQIGLGASALNNAGLTEFP